MNININQNSILLDKKLFKKRAIIYLAFVYSFVLYLFYDCIVKGNRGGLILFGALWGLAILGSIEPLPGSIEGLIYTETTFVEHFMVLLAGGVQVMLFSWLFLRWEHSIREEVDYYE